MRNSIVQMFSQAKNASARLVISGALIFGASAFGATNYACVSECLAQSPQAPALCQQLCQKAEPDLTIPYQPQHLKTVDQTCVTNCTETGNSYGLCESKCEY